MGLRRAYVDYIDWCMEKHLSGDPSSIRMLELGNQIVRDDMATVCKTGYEYWTSRGYNHVSIDSNGKDGAIRLDLSRRLGMFTECFDIVTDISVSCFVYDDEVCYENIYSFAKTGGCIVHILPCAGSRWTAVHRIHVDDAIEIVARYNPGGVETYNAKIIESAFGDLVAFSSQRIKE